MNCCCAMNKMTGTEMYQYSADPQFCDNDIDKWKTKIQFFKAMTIQTLHDKNALMNIFILNKLF